MDAGCPSERIIFPQVIELGGGRSFGVNDSFSLLIAENVRSTFV